MIEQGGVKVGFKFLARNRYWNLVRNDCHFYWWLDGHKGEVEKIMWDFTYKKSVSERYDIQPKGGCGWGIFTIDENGGVFHCQSDYGDYSYMWPNHGRDSFKHFLCEINTQYLLGKVAERDTFDYEKSFKKWGKAIIQMRRDRDCTKEQARDAWDFIHHYLDDCNDASVCQVRLYESEAISAICPDEPWYMFPTDKDYSPQALAFAHQLWPMFIDILKRELGASNG